MPIIQAYRMVGAAGDRPVEVLDLVGRHGESAQVRDASPRTSDER
jgi:hypothetical protein